MIENLLIISKDLLRAIEIGGFTQEDELYILNVIRKVVFVLLIELAKKWPHTIDFKAFKISINTNIWL